MQMYPGNDLTSLSELQNMSAGLAMLSEKNRFHLFNHK